MRKNIAIWALTSITFVSLVHLIEAISVIMFNNPIRLLYIYPFISESLKAITPQIYLYITATATVVFWGITCIIAFNNPVEKYLNQRALKETQGANVDKDELLDRMCETVECDHQTLTKLTDIVRKMEKGMKEEQTPPVQPAAAILSKNTIPSKKKSNQPKASIPKVASPKPARKMFTITQKETKIKTSTPTPPAKAVKETSKPSKLSLLHRTRKTVNKKLETQKLCIEINRLQMPLLTRLD
jgi:hypothetical protein